MLIGDFLKADANSLGTIRDLELTGNDGFLCDLHQLSNANFRIFCDNLSYCSNLEIIHLGYMSLKILSDDRLQDFCNALVNCTHLHSMKGMFCIYDMPSKNIEIFCNFLRKFPLLQSIDIATSQASNLPPKDFQTLCGVLKGFTKLRSLNISSGSLNDLSDECFQLFCNVLEGFTNLQFLNGLGFTRYLDSDSFNEDRFRVYCDILKKFANLRCIELHPEDLRVLSPEMLKLLYDSLAECRHLTSIDITKDHHNTYTDLTFISHEQFQALCNFLVKVPLRSLNLTNAIKFSELSIERIKLFFDTLVQCTQLQSLDLQGTLYSSKEEIVDALFTTLAKCGNLRRLHIGGQRSDTIWHFGNNLKTALSSSNSLFFIEGLSEYSRSLQIFADVRANIKALHAICLRNINRERLLMLAAAKLCTRQVTLNDEGDRKISISVKESTAENAKLIPVPEKLPALSTLRNQAINKIVLFSCFPNMDKRIIEKCYVATARKVEERYKELLSLQEVADKKGENMKVVQQPGNNNKSDSNNNSNNDPPAGTEVIRTLNKRSK